MEQLGNDFAPSLMNRLIPSTLCAKCTEFFSSPLGSLPSDGELKFFHSTASFEIRKSSWRGCAFCAHIDHHLSLSTVPDCKVKFSVGSIDWIIPDRLVWRVSAEAMKDDVEYYFIPLECTVVKLSQRLCYALKLQSEANTLYAVTTYALEFSTQDAKTGKHGIGPSTDSTTSRNLVKKWHRDCLRGHSECISGQPKQSWVPTRLVRYDGNSDTICIVNKKTRDSKIHYVALSHCWGKGNFLTLTAENSQELAEGIPMSCLPKTFRDAISVCRWLKYQYLWIDSLCIQQDSREDWLAEAHSMTDVYSNAALTIFAAHAADATEGLFINRDPKTLMPPLVRCSWNPSEPQKLFTLNDMRMRARNIDCCPLTRRAWTVQERFLSPRSLYFGEHQISYVCGKMHVCEAFPAGKMPLQVGEPAVRFCHKDVESRKMWESVVREYSAASLTKDTDRPIALSGVANKLQDLLKDNYVAGLWRSNIIHELLWHNEGSSGDLYRPIPCVAPTWSWMSVNGTGVRTNAIPCSSGSTPLLGRLKSTFGLDEPNKCKHHIEVLYVAVDSVDPNFPTGDIVPGSGIMQIRGQLKAAMWSLANMYSVCDWRRYQVNFDGEVGGHEKISSLTHPDTMDLAMLDKEISLLPVVTSYEDKMTQCLILTPIAKEAGLYERLGHVMLMKEDWMNPLLFKERSRVGLEEGQTLSGVEDGSGQSDWKDIPTVDIIII